MVWIPSWVYLLTRNLSYRYEERRTKSRSVSEGLMDMEVPFKIGDRVTRHVVALTKRQVDRIRHGVVTDVTAERLTNINMVTHRYSVRWDDTGQEEHGYMRGGLRHEKKEER